MRCTFVTLGLEGAADDVVWQRAINLGCVLITKDEDFHRRSVLKGAPPKVVWLRVGNCTTEDVERLLRTYWSRLERSPTMPSPH